MTTTPEPNPYPATVAPRGGAVGTASLVIGLVLVLVSVVQSILSVTLPLLVAGSGLGVSHVGQLFGVFNLLTAVVAVAGVITGIIGLQPTRPRGRLAAAAGLALAGAHLLSVIVVLVTTAVVSAF